MGEILLVLLFALLVYGGRLPEVARSLGRSLATLKRSLQETTDSVTRDVHSAIDLDLDERPRTVRRIPAAPAEPPRVSAASQKPAPTALATEDVSGEPPPDAPPA
jgi:sec-independent protein translocase protein TatA